MAIRFGSEMDQITRNFSEQFEKYIEQLKNATTEIGSVHESIFPIFTNFMSEIMKIGEPIKW